MSDDKQYIQARAQALELAKRAQQITTSESARRQKMRTFGVNPTCKVIVEHREVLRGDDSAQRWLDSQDFVTNPDAQVVAAVTKLAKGQTLTSQEMTIVTEAAKSSSYLRNSLEMYGKRISKSSSQNMDISETVLNWSLAKSMELGGGSLKITCMADKSNILRSVDNGDKFLLYIDNELIFWGVCMKWTYPNEWEIEYSVNDPMWYLKNGLVWIQNEEMTLAQAFVKICNELALPYEEPKLQKLCKLKPRVETNTTAMAILQSMIEETLVGIQKQYAIRMNPEKLELVDLEGTWNGTTLTKEGTQFDVIEAMTEFTASQSIEDATYTELNVYSNINNNLKLYAVQDLPSIEKYGILRYQEVVNNVIIKEEQLDNVMSLVKYETSDLNFSILGVVNVMPCDSIVIANSTYLVSSVDYNYTPEGYSMDITCARWQKPDPDVVGGEEWNFVEQYERMKEKTK